MKISKLNLTELKNDALIELNNTASNFPDEDFLPFGHKEEVEEAEYTKTELNAKIKESYERGLNEGKQQGVQETTKNVLTVEQSAEQGIKQILQSLTTALAEFETQKTAFKRDMSKLAHHVIKKILHDKISENGDEIILNSFEKILPLISKEPEINIKMNPNMLAKVQTKMEKLISANNFKGNIAFIPETTLNENICKVEWSANGINFDLKEKIKEIDEIINEYIKSI